jgi:hypothetical protein
VQANCAHRPGAWEEIQRTCVCFHDPSKLSLLLLVLVFMCDTSPGKDGGDTGKNLPLLLAFLISPLYRSVVVIVAEVTELHRKWVKLIDARSGVSDLPSCVGANMIETVVIERNILADIMALTSDWKVVLPGAAAFAASEALRAEHVLGLAEAPLMLPFLDTMMQECKHKLGAVCEIAQQRIPFLATLTGITDMMASAHGYLVNDAMEPSRLPLHLTDPTLARRAATGLLLAMRKNDPAGIPLSGEDILVATALQTDDPHVPPPSDPWTPACPVYAYPDCTHTEYLNHVRQSYTLESRPVTVAHTEHNRRVRGLTAGYGLRHPAVVSELRTIMHSGLQAVAVDAHGVALPVGTLLPAYWARFQQAFPAVADLLIHNFAPWLNTSVCVEQAFSCVEKFSHTNCTSAALKERLAHVVNVQGGIHRELADAVHRNEEVAPAAAEDEEDGSGAVVADVAVITSVTANAAAAEDRKNVMRNLWRTNRGLFVYLTALVHRTCIQLGKLTTPLPSLRSLQGPGRRIRDVQHHANHFWNEANANLRAPHKRINMARILVDVGRLEATYRARETVIEATPEEIYLQLANKRAWKVAPLRAYLLARYPDDPVRQQLIRKAPRRISEHVPEGESLQEILVQYWLDNAFTVAAAQELVEQQINVDEAAQEAALLGVQEEGAL